jgi:hypothetical protein
MAIAPAAAGEPKHIDHVGVGIENFSAPTMKSVLEKAGSKVRESNVGLFAKILLRIPTARTYRSGRTSLRNSLSNAAPEAGPKQKALFHSHGMHHLVIQVDDMARTTEFCRTLFSGSEVGLGNPPQPTSRLARPESCSPARHPLRRLRSTT